MTQSDLFDVESQGELFVSEPPQPVFRPDPEKVRARLFRILGEVRGAAALPWSEGRLSLYRTVVPQLTLLLPDDEGAQLRLEFETELKRLEAA